MALSKLEKTVLKEAADLIDDAAKSVREFSAPYDDEGEKDKAFREKMRDLAACLKCAKEWPV